MTIKYGKVTGRFLALVEDGSDQDDDPDFIPLTGSVTFTPSVSKVLTTDGEPVSVFPVAIKVTLDSEGYISHNSSRGVKLLSTLDGVNPANWTWKVSFDLRQKGKKLNIAPYSFEVPEYDPDNEETIIDLSRVAPVPGYNR